MSYTHANTAIVAGTPSSGWAETAANASTEGFRPVSSSTRGRFGDRTATAGSPLAAPLVGSFAAGGVVAAASLPTQDRRPRTVARPRAQSDATSLFSDARTAFQKAEQDAFRIIMRYRTHQHDGSRAPSGREAGERLARVLANFEGLQPSGTAAARLAADTSKLLDRITGSDGRRAASRIAGLVGAVEENMAAVQSSRHIRRDDVFRGLVAAAADADRDADDADALNALSGQVLIDYSNAISYLNALLGKSRRTDDAIGAFTEELQRHHASMATSRQPGESASVIITYPPDAERDIAASCLGMLRQDEQFIASFATGKKEYMEIDTEDMLLAIAEKVLDHARTFLAEAGQ